MVDLHKNQLETIGAVPGAGEMAERSTTTAQAIATALSVGGIKDHELKNEIAQTLTTQLPHLLLLGVEAFFAQREAPKGSWYDSLREAMDGRERTNHLFRVRIMGGTMVEEFQYWLLDKHKHLKDQVEEMEIEVSCLAPLAKHARDQGFNAELVANYNAKCVALFEAREELSLIEVHLEAATAFEESQLPNASEGMKLLWARFVEDGGVDEGARYP